MLGLVKQKLDKPFRVLIYGVEGVGKTEFGAESPDPVFLGNESGSDAYELYRFPAPVLFSDLIRDLKRLQNEKHDRKTVVIDSLDWLEPLLFSEVVRIEGKGKTIDTAHGGFDRGKIASVALWKQILHELDVLREKKGMNIVLIAHADATKFKDPALQADYMRYAPKLFKQSSALVKEWVDAIMFANFVSVEDQDGKVSGSGKRYMFTEHRPGWDAKNRFSMPYKLDVRFAEFIKYVKPESIESVRAKIIEMAAALPPDRHAALIKVLSSAGDDRRKINGIETTLIAELAKLPKESGL